MGTTCSVYASNPHSKLSHHELIRLLSPDLEKELSEETLQELFRMSTHAYKDFKNLILDIKSKNLILKSHHFNQIFQLIGIERKIFNDDFFTQLAKSCEIIDLHQEEYLTGLQEIHEYFQGFIQTQSLQNDLLHHAHPHALEVEHRMNLLLLKLEMFSEKDSLNILIRQLILEMVKYHDLIQIKEEQYHSAEENTAIICKQHFCSLFHLEEPHPLYTFIDYLSQMTIVIGTTVIWGQSYPVHMDLSELFLQFREIALTSEPLELSPTAQICHQNLSAIVVLMGVIDKYPAALTEIVDSQMQQTHSDLIGIQHYPRKIEKIYFDMLKKQPLLQFQTKEFHFQSCLIAIIPHIAMQLEFFKKKNPTQAHAFFSFIDMFRVLLKNGETSLNWLKESIGQKNIDCLFTEIFINQIPQEIIFCESLKGDLIFSKNYLKKNHPDAHLMIYEAALNLNIEFLKTLKEFFSNANFDNKLDIMMELIINLVIQKGFILEIQNKKESQTDSVRTHVSRTSFSMYSPTSAQSSIHTTNLSHQPK